MRASRARRLRDAAVDVERGSGGRRLAHADGRASTAPRTPARGPLVAGFFEGPRCEPFAHKVITAYRWPVDELARRLGHAGFVEVERLQRPRDGERRPHGAISVIAR